MAKKLDQFPDRTRRGIYPWDKWLNGEIWLLRRGKGEGDDYETTTASMRATAVSAAKRAGKRVRTQVTTDEDGTEALIIQAID